MSGNKPQRLSEVVPQFAPQGVNDARWFMVEHELLHGKICFQTAMDYLLDIITYPENGSERLHAKECLDICRDMVLSIQGRYLTLLSYLSGTDVPERISRKEL